MGFLNTLEHEFVLGNLDVYNEFDNSHFIANAKSSITNKIEKVNVNFKFNYYTDMIEKAIASFSTIKLDKSKVKDFLIKATDSQLDYSSIKTHDINIDNTVFKPQYLGQYINIVKEAIDKAINGNLSNSDSMKFITNEYVTKVEKQIIKTNIPYGISCKEVQKETLISADFITVDKSFIKEKVIPFVTKYDDIKNSTTVEANAVLNAINEAEINVKAMLSSLDKVRGNSDIDFNNIRITNQVAYNSIRGLIDIISFVSLMLIHKLNVISSNIITCNKLYDDVFNLTNGNIVESAFDNTVVPNDNASISDDLIDGKTSAFDVLADNIYNYHAGMIDTNNIDIIDKSNDIEYLLSPEAEDRYSKEIYADINNVYNEISSGLNHLAKEGGEYLLVFDDIVASSGFRIMLQDKYKNVVERITNMSLYDGANNLTHAGTIDSNVYTAIMAEVKDYSSNMQTIANNIQSTYNKLCMIQERFTNNFNNEYSDLETINELRIFLKDLREQFITLTQLVANNFMLRLQKLGKILVDMDIAKDNTTVDETMPVITTSSIDISESVFENDYNEKVGIQKEYFKALQRSYIIEKSLSLKNENVIFEADNNNGNNGTNTVKNQQNNTKPVVTDNNANANNSTTNNTNNSTGIEKLQNFINNVFEKIKQTLANSSKNQSKKNMKFIQDNENYLTNRSYSNTTTRVVEYSKDVNAVVTDLNNVKNKINALTPQVIQNVKNETELYNKILPVTNVTSENMATQFTNYFTTGNINTAPAVKEYSNNENKNLVVNGMIPSCKEYASEQTLNSLTQAYNDLQKVLTDKINSMNTQQPNATTESVSIFTEADNNTAAPNTQTSINEKLRWLTKVASEFSQAGRTVLQNKNNDYLKVLEAFRQKVQKSPANITDGNDNGEPGNNQQPTQQNQTNNQQPTQQPT